VSFDNNNNYKFVFSILIKMKIHPDLRYINLEGGPGNGKSTQSVLLKEYLENKGYKVSCFEEPSKKKGTIGRDIIRDLFLKGLLKVDAYGAMCLYYADRRDKNEVEYQPALDLGEIVIGARNYDSTAVYQTQRMGLDVNLFKQYHNLNKAFLAIPDLNIIMDVDPYEAAKRRYAQKNDEADVFEAKADDMRKTFEGYNKLPSLFDDEKFVMINARGNINEVRDILIKVIEAFDPSLSKFMKLESGFYVLR